MSGLKIRDLGEQWSWGSRVDGVTWDNLYDPETRAELKALFEKRGYIIFENTDPSPKMQMELSQVFAPLKDHPTKSTARADKDADELIGLICHVYGGPGTDILMAMHGFTMYQISGTFSGARVIKVPEKNLTTDVDAMIEAVTPETTIVFVAHPNNPTGSLLPQAEITRLRAGLRPDILLVLDSAYAEYVEAADYNAGEALVDAGDNTVMLRTFSKVYGLGGMRVGWGYMPPAVADALNRVRGVFNVNLAAQAAAVAALEEPGWVEKCRAHNTEHRAKITASLNAIGIKTWPSEGNFFLADFQTAARATAADAFLKTRGIIVRAMAAYYLPQCLRITVGTAEECALVTDALAGFMKTAAAHG